HNCYLETLKSNVPVGWNSKNAASKMNILVGNDLYKLFLFEKEDSKVNEHVKDYDRSIYIQKEAWKSGESYSVRLCNINNIFSLMRGIIEANYRYCIHHRNKLGSDKKVSFAYLKGLSIPLSNTVGLKLYNKSTVRSRGDVFIVNKIHDERSHNICCSEICFFYSKAG
ncbi:MAG: hypothetical protein PF482_18115, partial [Desulfobacteraceae bacterium]|nr:hypothetical protein [Desulfobacteraceae bacterium]